MYILVNAYENRSVEVTQKTIGKTFENEATILKILLHGDMVENDVYLEFKKEDCSKFMTQPLQIVNDEDNNYYVEYKMPNSLLDQVGNLRMEIVLRKDDYVWKSYAIDFDVLDSINASDEVAQDNEDFFSYVMDRVNVIQKDGEGTKYLADDGTYKEVQGGASDYDDLTNKPITRIVSGDSSNKYPLRDLETGQYILTGYFTPYKGIDVSMVAMDVFTIVTRTDSTSYIQMIFPFNNQIQYIKTTDTSYEMNFLSLNNLQKKMNVVENTYSTSVTIQLNDRNSFQYTKDLKKLTVNLPANIEAGYNAQIVFNSGSTATEFIFDEEITWIGDDVSNSEFTPQPNRYYTIDVWKDVNKLIAKVLAI